MSILVFFSVLVFIIIILPIIILFRNSIKTNKIISLQREQEKIQQEKEERRKEWEQEKRKEEKIKQQNQIALLKKMDDQRRKYLYQGIENQERKAEEKKRKREQENLERREEERKKKKEQEDIRRREEEQKTKILQLQNKNIEGIGRIFETLSPKELHSWSARIFTGVYIIYNKENNRAYVGQAKNVMKRLHNHFSGNGGNKGSEEFYKDYQAEMLFEVYAMKLNDSNFDSLDELERKLIKHYKAYPDGYNKNLGNRG